MGVAEPRERYVAEFVGTFLLVFTVGICVLLSAPLAALAIGTVLMVLVYALGSVSGGHFNPAVTLAVWYLGTADLTAADLGIYAACQMGAGLAAAGALVGWFGNPWNTTALVLGPGEGFSWWEAVLMEVIFTFLLVFTVLNCACTDGVANSKKENQFFGLAIGFSLVAGAMAAGFISGAALNPAVALGIDAAGAKFQFGWCLVYTLAELFGAMIAASVFMELRMHGRSEPTLPRKLAAEGIGTFILVLAVGLNVLQGVHNPGAVIGIAATLLVLVYSLGDISGGHFNPAVTTAVVACGKSTLDYGTAAMYAGVQVVCGVLAGLLYMVVAKGAFPLGPGKTYAWGAVVVAELVYTFFLCFVVLSVAVASRAPAYRDVFGLAIGFTIVVGGFAIGSISGGCLNPAVALGIDVASAFSGGKFGASLIYLLVEVAAGMLAAGAFYVVNMSAEYSKETV
mmetsp:Transcript_21280/g.51480  ORF Transcript_21280/g.51480 Transcript_21280/m.51480 type:complete len:454 (+) Transcript_21280:47-1408(+)